MDTLNKLICGHEFVRLAPAQSRHDAMELFGRVPGGTLLLFSFTFDCLTDVKVEILIFFCSMSVCKDVTIGLLYLYLRSFFTASTCESDRI